MFSMRTSELTHKTPSLYGLNHYNSDRGLSKILILNLYEYLNILLHSFKYEKINKNDFLIIQKLILIVADSYIQKRDYNHLKWLKTPDHIMK